MNPEKPKKGVYVDYETGLIHAPGKKPLPLVGLDVAPPDDQPLENAPSDPPSLNTKVKRMKEREHQAMELKARMEQLLRSVFLCIQCGPRSK